MGIRARYFRTAIVLAILSLMVLLGNATAAPGTRPRQVSGVVILPRLSSLPTLVAAEEFAPRCGVQIKWSFFQSDGAIAQAFASGAAELVVSNWTRLVQLHEAGVRVKMFVIEWNSLDWILVSKTDIVRLTDLKGKRLGISSPGSTTDLLTRSLLERHGVEPKDVQILAIGGAGARATAMAANRIDASWLGFDGAYSLLQSGKFHALEDMTVAKEFPGYQATGWYARLGYIERNPEVIGCVTLSAIQAARWARNKLAFLERARTSTVQPISALGREEASWTYDQLLKVNMWDQNGGLSRESYQQTLGVALRAGEIKAIPPFDEVATTQFQEAALRQLGRR